MTYKKEHFYFLHIRHTGGKALYKHVLNKFFYQENLNKKTEEIFGKHDGWHENINDNTYILCVVREPIQEICSLLINTLYPNLEKEFGSYENIQKSIVDIIKTKPFLHNFQSKNILGGGGYSYYQKQEEALIIDEDLLQKRLTRINYLISNDYLKHNMQSVANKIALDFGLEKINIGEINTLEYTHYKSKELYESLTQEQKLEISEYLNYDYMLYKKAGNGKIWK